MWIVSITFYGQILPVSSIFPQKFVPGVQQLAYLNLNFEFRAMTDFSRSISHKVDFSSFCSRKYRCQPNSEDITKFLGQFWTFHITKPFFIL